jgi:hypothetical protein
VTDVSAGKYVAESAVGDAFDEQLVRQLAARAQPGGLRLTGEGGLLARLTKRVVEGALEGEMDAHLGYPRHDPAGRDGGNSRNGTRAKTVLTEAGPVEVDVPRDRDGSFTPRIVPKRRRRLDGVDDLVVSLSAKGLTHGEICAHLAEVYDAEVSKETISRITDRVMDGLAEWQNRPLDPVYPVIFVGCINVKIRDGQVANRPICIALAVTCDRGAGHPRAVGRRARRRGGRQVLAAGADRGQEPRRERLLHPGLRRAERPPAGRRGDLAADHRADLHRALCRSSGYADVEAGSVAGQGFRAGEVGMIRVLRAG